MAKKQNPFLAKIAKYGRIVEFGEAKVLVRPASVGQAQAFAAAQKRWQADGEESRFNEHVVSVFISQACDPDTGEPFFAESERATVIESVPFPVILKVVQAAVGIDPEAAAKN